MRYKFVYEVGHQECNPVFLDGRKDCPRDSSREVAVRIVVIMVAVASALAGVLLGGQEGPVQAEPEGSDIALFV